MRLVLDRLCTYVGRVKPFGTGLSVASVQPSKLRYTYTVNSAQSAATLLLAQRRLVSTTSVTATAQRNLCSDKFGMAETDELKRISTTERLHKLRALMVDDKYRLTAYVIPSEDAHQSEYIASCDARRAYISGFTGSAGCAVVTRDAAALFTDGRYFLQASQQLDNNWTLMRQGVAGVPTWQEYIVLVSTHDAAMGCSSNCLLRLQVLILRCYGVCR